MQNLLATLVREEDYNLASRLEPGENVETESRSNLKYLYTMREADGGVSLHVRGPDPNEKPGLMSMLQGGSAVSDMYTSLLVSRKGLVNGTPIPRLVSAGSEGGLANLNATLDGLKSKPELNGAAVVITKWAADRQRYAVKLEDGTTLAAKPENLLLRTWCTKPAEVPSAPELPSEPLPPANFFELCCAHIKDPLDCLRDGARSPISPWSWWAEERAPFGALWLTSSPGNAAALISAIVRPPSEVHRILLELAPPNHPYYLSGYGLDAPMFEKLAARLPDLLEREHISSVLVSKEELERVAKAGHIKILASVVDFPETHVEKDGRPTDIKWPSMRIMVKHKDAKCLTAEGKPIPFGPEGKDFPSTVIWNWRNDPLGNTCLTACTMEIGEGKGDGIHTVWGLAEGYILKVATDCLARDGYVAPAVFIGYGGSDNFADEMNHPSPYFYAIPLSQDQEGFEKAGKLLARGANSGAAFVGRVNETWAVDMGSAEFDALDDETKHQLTHGLMRPSQAPESARVEAIHVHVESSLGSVMVIAYWRRDANGKPLAPYDVKAQPEVTGSRKTATFQVGEMFFAMQREEQTSRRLFDEGPATCTGVKVIPGTE